MATSHLLFHYMKQWLCRVPQALGKGFAECNTRQTAHGIYSAGKRLFAECFLLGTRQILCRELKPTLGGKKVTRQRGDGHDAFAECPRPDTRQTCHVCRVSNPGHSANLPSLPSVKSRALDKPVIFVECQILDIRQILAQNVQLLTSLPSVTVQTLGKEAILVLECIDFGHVSSLPSVFTLALGKMPLCRV